MGNQQSLLKDRRKKKQVKHPARNPSSASSVASPNSNSPSSSPSHAKAESYSAGASSSSKPSVPSVSAPTSAPNPGTGIPIVPASPSKGQETGEAKYGRPDELGLERVDFINVHRKDFTGRIELLRGSVEGLAAQDETDLLIVYLRQRGQYKANKDSALAALNRSGYSLAQLEQETKPQPSYRRHYHCWLSRPLPKPRPTGFEFKRLLVYEDPGEELTRDDNIVLDIMKCLTTVIGGDVQIQSVMIPLSGALLSPSLRAHLVKACAEVSYTWLQMGLPIRDVRILLPPVDITKEAEGFAKMKAKFTNTDKYEIKQSVTYDVFFSYAEGDKDAARQMMEYLRTKNSSVRIFDAEPRQEVSIKERGVVNMGTMEAISQSRIFLSLLSDDYFHSVECTEAFSLAYCRDFESQGNFIIPLFWKSCDLTPLARRLVATEGVDCREGSFDQASMLLDEILSALENLEKMKEEAGDDDDALDGQGSVVGDRGKMNVAERLLMQKDEKMAGKQDLFETSDVSTKEQAAVEENPDAMFFDSNWRTQWGTEFSSIVFGPRIGAGGFGEVYKCKWDSRMVAVKTLQKIEDEDPQAVFAEFMVEMKLMSKLQHANVVLFLGACVQTPRLAIILEFMAGGSLYRAIHRRRRNGLGPFPLLKSLWIAFGIAKGMTYLHGQYPVVIHRDLKSPNILLGTNVREVKVTDFGLSRLRVNTFVNTGPGGTPEWMAPELLRQDPFDEQSDVFSFGVILWELMMCEKPWKDDHPMQIVFKVGSRGEKLQPPPVEQCIPEIREMIVKCFADVPKNRPTFAELSDALDALCHRPDFSKKAGKK